MEHVFGLGVKCSESDVTSAKCAFVPALNKVCAMGNCSLVPRLSPSTLFYTYDYFICV